MNVRLAAVGLGGLGRLELDVLDSFDDVELLAGADPSTAARNAVEAAYGIPTYEDVEALLDAHGTDLDAVGIVTPHTLHYDQAMACLGAGLDVFLEKPMVTDVADAVSLVETARASDRVLQVGYQRHFDPAFQLVREAVSSGRIGTVVLANGMLGQDWIEPHRGTWRTDPALSGGGQLYDSGSHLLDALLWTTDAEPKRVASTMAFRDGAVDVESALALVLDRDGRQVVASVGVSGHGSTGEPHESLTIQGTDGRVAYRDGEVSVVEDGDVVRDGPVEGAGDFETTTRRKLADFVDSVATRRKPAVPGEFGLQVTALTEAAYRATAEARTVAVDDLLDEAGRGGAGRVATERSDG